MTEIVGENNFRDSNHYTMCMLNETLKGENFQLSII